MDARVWKQREREHIFNAEQANGTLLVVDEMVDSGIDRVLGSIESLRSEMAAREERMLNSIASVRSEMDVRFKVIDNRFNAIDNRLKTMEMRLPIKSAFFTLAILAAAFAIFGQ